MDELNEIDSIVNEANNSSNNEIPMEGVPEEIPQETQAPQTPQEFEFTSFGKQVKVPYNDPRVKQWLSMGYEAPNKFGQLNRELENYKQQAGRFQEYEKLYKPIDDWARKNPEQWQSLSQNWQEQINQNRSQGLPPELMQKLDKHEQILTQVQQQEEARRIQAFDQRLDGEVESIRKENPHLDFSAIDQSGNSLEARILDHGLRNGIPSFRAAFRDYCHDNLVKFAEERGKQSAGRTMSKSTKEGLLGKSSTPSRGSTPDLKSKNYDQIHEMILESMGL